MSALEVAARSWFRYCPHCAASLTRLEVDGRERAVCTGCGFIQYRNPIAGVAAVVSELAVLRRFGERATTKMQSDPEYLPLKAPGRVLLGRRATSYRGLWCFPCGYVEYDEEIRDALVREALEETGLLVEPGRVIAVESNFHQPENQTVGVWIEALPVGGTLTPGDELDALVFFDPASSIPLAFPTDRLVLDRLARPSGTPPRGATPEPWPPGR